MRFLLEHEHHLLFFCGYEDTALYHPIQMYLYSTFQQLKQFPNSSTNRYKILHNTKINDLFSFK